MVGTKPVGGTESNNNMVTNNIVLCKHRHGMWQCAIHSLSSVAVSRAQECKSTREYPRVPKDIPGVYTL